VAIKCCSFSGDGRFAAAGAADGSLAVWDVSGPEPRLAATSHVPEPPANTGGGDAADEGRRRSGSGSGNSSGSGGGELGVEGARAPPAECGRAPDGGTDQEEGEEVGGSRSGGSGLIKLTRLSPDAVLCCCMSHDGSVLAAGARAGRVGVWSSARRTLARLPPCHAEGAKVRAVALAPDGRHLVTGGDDARVVLWDLARGAPLLAAQEHLRPVRALAFSPDGRRVASCGDDCLIAVADFALLTTYGSLCASAGAAGVRAGAWLGDDLARGSSGGAVVEADGGGIRTQRSAGEEGGHAAGACLRPHPLLRRLRVTDGERLVLCALGEAPHAAGQGGALGVLGPPALGAALEGPPDACEQPLLCLEQGGQVRAGRCLLLACSSSFHYMATGNPMHSSRPAALLQPSHYSMSRPRPPTSRTRQVQIIGAASTLPHPGPIASSGTVACATADGDTIATARHDGSIVVTSCAAALDAAGVLPSKGSVVAGCFAC
jgi:WD40 repeat protein